MGDDGKEVDLAPFAKKAKKFSKQLSLLLEKRAFELAEHERKKATDGP